MRLHIILCILVSVWQQEGCFVSGEVYYTKGAPHVKLGNGGLISGEVKFSRDGRPYNAFQGIKYGSVSERFMESTLITKPTWEGTLKAVKPGLMCNQMSFVDLPDQLGDDCLSLNVYIPITENGPGKKGYPVMFWIHGGGYMMGSGNDGPEHFMDEEVILVMINYRLGVFGFLNTGDDVVPGNNGLKDMVVALRWVRDNIKQFGGNQDSVTIFGVSAGGSAVHYLMLNPAAKGLFHGAIAQSGTAFSMWAYDPDPRRNAVEFATHLKCPTTAAEPSGITSEEILTCLKEKPAAELIMAQVSYKLCWPSSAFCFTFVPSHESRSTLNPFLTEPPMLAVTEKNQNDLPDVPLMVGAVEAEGAWMSAVVLGTPERLEEINEDWENIAPSGLDYDKYVAKDKQREISEKLKKFYFGKSVVSAENRKALTNLFSDDMFLHGSYKTAMEASKNSNKRSPVYFYQYAYRGPSLVSMFLNVSEEEKKALAEQGSHGDDILMMVNLSWFPGAANIMKSGTKDEQFSKNYVRLLASFAIHGEPKHTWGNDPNNKWEALSNDQLNGKSPLTWYKINSNPATVEVDKSIMDRMKLWDELWSQYLTPAVTEA